MSSFLLSNPSTNLQGFYMANKDWSEMPLDIFRLICKRLPDIYDLVAFRAVCKTWWSCVCDPPLQLPWILQHRKHCDDPALRFYSLSLGKVISINCDRSRNKFFLGPSYHYLLTYCPTESGFLWSLLNPLTNNEIPLPPLEKEDQIYCVKWIGPNPAGTGESAIISKCGFTSLYSSVMNLSQSEDHDAVEFALQGMNGDGRLCHKGEFFIVDNLTGVTKVTDITTQKLVYELPPIEPLLSQYYWKYWIVESGGEIFMLCKMPGINPVYFEIYLLDLKNGKDKASWVQVDSIAEQVLFLDEHRGLSFSSKDYKGLRENCIYLLECNLLFKYDIKNSTAENLYYPFAGCNGTWFIPRPY